MLLVRAVCYGPYSISLHSRRALLTSSACWLFLAGGASLSSGQMEVMVHRRTLAGSPAAAVLRLLCLPCLLPLWLS